MPAPMRPYRIEVTGRPRRVRSDAVQASADTMSLTHGLPSNSPPLPDGAELRRMRGEFVVMKGAIDAAKDEIASLQASSQGASGVHRAAIELDAVVSETERATTTILEAVEEIEHSANMLRATGHDTGRLDPVGAILDRVLTLYEACNFQDVTGQRIRKVVSTLQFVEERLDAVIGLWDPSDLASRHDDLLAGPAVPGDAGHVSQRDVDLYFPARRGVAGEA